MVKICRLLAVDGVHVLAVRSRTAHLTLAEPRVRFRVRINDVNVLLYIYDVRACFDVIIIDAILTYALVHIVTK